MKSTIGIIGGSGPLATLDIEQKIFFHTSELMHPLTDQDYFNVVIFNYVDTYDRNDSVCFGRPDPLSQYLNYVDSISEMGVDLILIACNTAHMHLPILREKTKVPIISLIEKTINYLQKEFPDCRKVGLISTKATVEKRIYHTHLLEQDIEIVTLSHPLQELIMQAIYLIKAGINLSKREPFLENSVRASKVNTQQGSILKNHPYKHTVLQQRVPNPINIIEQALKELRSQGCQHVILGCTELPLALPYLKKMKNLQLIDPNTIIACEIIEALHDIELKKWADLEVSNSARRYI